MTDARFTTALIVGAGSGLSAALARALAKDGMTMIVVTHEMGFARKVANRVVFMDKGEIVEDAPTADFFGKPRSERAQMFLSKILQH